mmetsp:Transcript_11199/g.14736  ORF Transcript_11199/g.14736 Transcript_11199/m.14736 type:complete len:486 (-) Transcript_11199:63-1520(-)
MMRLFGSSTAPALFRHAATFFFLSIRHGKNNAFAFVLENRSPSRHFQNHAGARGAAASISSTKDNVDSISAQAAAAAAAAAATDEVSQNDNDNNNESIIRQIFTNDIPLLDVRAEVEFVKGAFPNSVNIPILNDEQRHLVGTCYKEKGPEAAFELGVQLVTPVKEERVKAWKEFAEANPTGYMYCFRGGSRSHIAQAGIKEVGINYPLVAGGYKEMRQFLIDELEKIQNLPIVMIGGRTGSGKTRLLKHFTSSEYEHYEHVDLEGLANHRGSAFGGFVHPQPTAINFENALAIDFLKLQQRRQQQQQQQSSLKTTHPPTTIFIEEEGRRIGKLVLPLSMYSAMVDHYPAVELETPMEDRVQICVEDYVTDEFPLFEAAYGDLAHEKFRQERLESLRRIKNKVAHNYDVIHKQVCEALDLFQESGGIDASGFCKPTEAMLQYYDKFYDYQMDQRKGEVLFRGDSQAIIEWAKSEDGRQKLALATLS